MIAESENYYTLAEVAQQLRLSKASVRRMIEAEQLPCHRFSKKTIRISGKQLAAFVASAITTTLAAKVEVEWKPTLLQARILETLKGWSYRTDRLASLAGTDRSQLFRKDCLPELQKRGLVGWDKRLGYYSTEFPPAELGGVKA